VVIHAVVYHQGIAQGEGNRSPEGEIHQGDRSVDFTGGGEKA